MTGFGDNSEVNEAARAYGKRLLLVIFAFAAVMLIGLVTVLLVAGRPGWAGSPGGAGDQDAPSAALAAMKIPKFSLVDQNGKPFSRDDLRDRLTILAFTFTNCPTACPVMHSLLIRLQREITSLPVRIVSITVDPAHDTPEVLKTHAQRLGADPKIWLFLTGDVASIHDIVRSLGFALTEDAGTPITRSDGSAMTNIVHPTKLLLIGPNVDVLAMESGLEWESVQRMAAHARRWTASLPFKGPGS